MASIIPVTQGSLPPIDKWAAEEAVRTIIEYIGDDSYRDGLCATPGRVRRSWEEIYSGYKEDPTQHLEVRFESSHDQMVTIQGVEFFSICEHHMLPFFGTADLAYIPKPGSGVVGLSKLARVVQGYARRLQIQERLTDEIADALDTLDPLGVAVRLRAKHFCMVSRGVRSSGSEMVTTAIRGAFRDPVVKQEWLASL